MISVALVTARPACDRLEGVARRTREAGGVVWLAPSAGPDAPSPFAVGSGRALGELGWRVDPSPRDQRGRDAERRWRSEWPARG